MRAVLISMALTTAFCLYCLSLALDSMAVFGFQLAPLVLPAVP